MANGRKCGSPQCSAYYRDRLYHLCGIMPSNNSRGKNLRKATLRWQQLRGEIHRMKGQRQKLMLKSLADANESREQKIQILTLEIRKRKQERLEIENVYGVANLNSYADYQLGRKQK